MGRQGAEIASERNSLFFLFILHAQLRLELQREIPMGITSTWPGWSLCSPTAMVQGPQKAH